MPPTVKVDIYQKIQRKEKIIIESGCGSNLKKGRIGINKLDLPLVDIIANLEKCLPFLPDNSVDDIYSKSFLEHVEKFKFLMIEIHRVLKNDWKKHLFVPHFSNPYFYSDYTHRRIFGLNTLFYFVDKYHQLRRKVSAFYQSIRLKILSKKNLF
jgi:predicted SAM-dependent methyltransferase